MLDETCFIECVFHAKAFAKRDVGSAILDRCEELIDNQYMVTNLVTFAVVLRQNGV
nr:hypothetical protein [Ligilactobacillus agilis]